MITAADRGQQAAAVVAVRRDVVGDRIADVTVVPVLFCPHVQIIPSRAFPMSKFRLGAGGRRRERQTSSLIFICQMGRIEA
jgi:hypothetical protein